MGKSASEIKVGDKYYQAVEAVICLASGVNTCLQIWSGNHIMWEGSETNGTITVDKPYLHGTAGQGGVGGVIDFEDGNASQALNTYLSNVVTGLIGYGRGLFRAVFHENATSNSGFYWSNANINNNPLSFIVNGVANDSWNPSWATITNPQSNKVGDNYNPVHFHRDLIVDEDALGLDTSVIDETSYALAAETLYNEGFGISGTYFTNESVSDFLAEIERTVDGVHYELAGKFYFYLFREAQTSILTLDESNIESIANFKEKKPSQKISQVNIEYINPENFNKAVETVTDSAIFAEFGLNYETLQYNLIRDADLARKVGYRELRKLNSTLRTCTIKVNREAYLLRPSNIVTVSWAKYNLSSVNFRVLKVNLGSFDVDYISLDVIEDIFGSEKAVSSASSISDWVNPVNAPAPAPFEGIYDTLYWELAQTIGDDDAQSKDGTISYITTYATSPSLDSSSGVVYSDFDADTNYDETNECVFVPTATINAAISEIQTSITIQNSELTYAIEEDTYALIDDEIVAIEDISALPFITIGRGCLDSIPAQHAINSRIFFLSQRVSTDGLAYIPGQEANIKILPFTNDLLDISLAANLNLVTTARYFKPYPPQKIRINGLAYPASIAGNNEWVITWNQRNRLNQTQTLYNTEYGNIPHESGTTYNVSLRRQDTDALIKAYTGLTGQTVTFTLEDMSGELGFFKLIIEAERNGETSFYQHVIVIERLPHDYLLDFSDPNNSMYIPLLFNGGL